MTAPRFLPDVDSWRADERYETARNALAEHDGAYSLDFCEDILSGKYGFICQYDRKTNADTVCWQNRFSVAATAQAASIKSVAGCGTILL